MTPIASIGFSRGAIVYLLKLAKAQLSKAGVPGAQLHSVERIKDIGSRIMTEEQVQAWFAKWTIVERDYAISMMSKDVARRVARSSSSSDEGAPAGVCAEIAVHAVDMAVHGLLCWLWSDERIRMHYVNDDGTTIDMKKASDGWHGDYVGFSTHGGWIHELSKFKDGVPPIEHGPSDSNGKQPS